MPAEYSPASYWIESLVTRTTAPFSGLVSWPSSCTESPSGSTPESGIGIVTVWPAKTRAVTVFGTGGLLVEASSSRTAMVTCAVAHCPSGASTR